MFKILLLLIGGLYIYSLLFSGDASKTSSGGSNGGSSGESSGGSKEGAFSIWYNANIYWPGEIRMYKSNYEKYLRKSQTAKTKVESRRYEIEYLKWYDAWQQAEDKLLYYKNLEGKK